MYRFNSADIAKLAVADVSSVDARLNALYAEMSKSSEFASTQAIVACLAMDLALRFESDENAPGAAELVGELLAIRAPHWSGLGHWGRIAKLFVCNDRFLQYVFALLDLVYLI